MNGQSWGPAWLRPSDSTFAFQELPVKLRGQCQETLQVSEIRAALFSLALLSLQIPAGLFPTQFFTSDHSETHTEQKKKKNTWRPIKVPEYSRALASLTLLPSTPVLSPPPSSGWFCRRSPLPPESDPSKCHGLKGSLVRVMLVST